MFAAAAVAAAAALTAISTTSAVGNIQPQLTNQQLPSHLTKPPLTWHQYAMQRRNSMQRRKLEIDKRIKQASNEKSTLLSNELKQFQPNTSKANHSLKPASSLQAEQSGLNQDEIIQNLASQDSEIISNEPWMKGLSVDVCNEFIRLHNIHKADSHNFSDSQTSQIEMNDISQALIEFLKSNNLTEDNQFLTELKQVNINLNPLSQQSLDYRKASHLAQVQGRKSNRRSRQKFDSIRYKWNPRWLRLLRKTTCLPVALITLFLLIFTNISSNWIYIEENQRAGLWAVCKSKIDLSSPNSLKYLQSNEFENTNSLARKLKRTKDEKPRTIEECHAKFLLKDDTHLVVLALIIVGFFFHLIGLVFLVIGLVFTTSNKTLYYYHSAGECLLSSAIILGIDLFAFASLVSSQIDQSYKFGYCFYTNLIVSLFTLFYSLLFYLDDFVTEYRQWRKKLADENLEHHINY